MATMLLPAVVPVASVMGQDGWLAAYRRAEVAGLPWAPGGGYFDPRTHRIVVGSANGPISWQAGAVLSSPDTGSLPPFLPGGGTTGNPAFCRPSWYQGQRILAWSAQLGSLWGDQSGWFNSGHSPVPISSGVSRQAMIYDAGADEVMLLVEQTSPPVTTAWYCSQSSGWLPVPLPTANDYFGGLVYDPQLGRVLLTDAGAFVWVAQLGAWNPIAAPATFATGRALAYDTALQQIVAFGGLTGAAVINDTLSFDGIQWNTLAPATSPAARQGATLVYDAARQVHVLFGGFDAGAGSFTDVWEFDGLTWTSQVASTTKPPARADAAMTDTSVGGPVLFGGRDAAGNARNDTWQFDGTQWTQQSSTVSPPARSHACMTSTAQGDAVLFGGLSAGGATLDDLWIFAAGQWTQMAPGLPPVGIWNGASAIDGLGRLWISGGRGFSGLSGDVYRRDPYFSPGLWMQASSSLIQWREGHSMVYDQSRNRLVVFGGITHQGQLASTLEECDPSGFFGAWLPRNPASSISPPPRTRATMVYDPAKRRVVMSGGYDPVLMVRYRDQWEWDGYDWMLTKGDLLPEPTEGAAAAFDAVTGRIVMFGGRTDTSPVSDRTLEIEQRIGLAAPQANTAILSVTQMPVPGGALALEVEVDTPVGLAALFFDTQLGPTPFLVVGAPLFCGPSVVYLNLGSGSVGLTAVGSPARFSVMLPALSSMTSVMMQAVRLNPTCLEATDAFYLQLLP